MALRHVGDKPLSELMMALFTNGYMQRELNTVWKSDSLLKEINIWL